MTEGLSNARQQTERGGEALLQISLDRAGQYRRRAFGSNRDCDWVTIDYGGRDELAVGKVVDDVYLSTIRVGQGRNAGIFRVILIRGVEQDRAHRVACLQSTRDVGEFALRRPSMDFNCRIFCKNSHLRGRLQDQPQFRQGSVTATRQNNATASNGHEDRKVVHGEGFLRFLRPI